MTAKTNRLYKRFLNYKTTKVCRGFFQDPKYWRYEYNNFMESSFLKYCSWKGIPIECAAIFTTFPTDSGVCCAFNLQSAEDIFRDQRYTNLVTSLQTHDKNYSVSDPTLPDWYSNTGEPKTSAGRNKGLFVMLDAHSDLFTTSSLEQDYTSFTGLISYRGSFPYMAQEGFEIRLGVHFTNIL